MDAHGAADMPRALNLAFIGVVLGREWLNPPLRRTREPGKICAKRYIAGNIGCTSPSLQSLEGCQNHLMTKVRLIYAQARKIEGELESKLSAYSKLINSFDSRGYGEAGLAADQVISSACFSRFLEFILLLQAYLNLGSQLVQPPLCSWHHQKKQLLKTCCVDYQMPTTPWEVLSVAVGIHALIR